MVTVLHRADGSANCSLNGYTVVAATNGPLEVQRRDELPEEAAIEVNIRPATGVASTKERHLEGIIQTLLKRIILTKSFPRTLIQLTLQVISSSDQTTTKSPALSPLSPLPLLPALLQATLLSLIAGTIPLETTYATVVKTFSTSYHVFVFSGESQLLLAESEGDFAFDQWSHACREAEEESANTIAEMRGRLGQST